MVAASKMRKAQERMRAARPYAERVRSLAANLVARDARVHAPVHGRRTTRAKTVGFIVVTTDKGLCGGLNTNVLRAVTLKLRELAGRGRQGRGGRDRQQGPRLPEPHRRARSSSHVTQLGDTPQLEKLIGPVKVLLDAVRRRQARRRATSATRASSTRCSQEPMIEQLLPLSAEQHAAATTGKHALGLHLRARRARS